MVLVWQLEQRRDPEIEIQPSLIWVFTLQLFPAVTCRNEKPIIVSTLKILKKLEISTQVQNAPICCLQGVFPQNRYLFTLNAAQYITLRLQPSLGDCTTN